MRSYLLFIGFTALTVYSFAQDSISVLFIGNSYTSVNNLPSVTQLLSESLGKQLTIGSKTNGGFSLQAHSNDAQTYTAMHQNEWDVVVLQAQSQEPSFPYDQVNTETIPYAIRLADSVYAINPCSNVLFYMTWGRENGDPQWDSIATFEGMNQRLYNAYMRMADSTDAMVAAVGAVWNYVRDNHPAIQLYAADGSHPSLAGTYLAACTFYTSLFQSSVTGATYTAGLDQQTVAQLQAAADAVVLDSLDHFHLHPVSQPVQAVFTYSEDAGLVQFTNLSLRDEIWEWHFGDGLTDNTENPVHNYGGNGTYIVQLIASNLCSSDTVSQSIQINSLGLDNQPPVSFHLTEFNDHFVVSGEAKSIYYEIRSMDGKIIISDKILTSDSQRIEKILSQGVFLLRNEHSEEFIKSFVAW